MIIMIKVIIVIIVLKKFKKIILKISKTLNDSKANIYIPKIEVQFPEEFDP